jgi:hypothetical protein
LDNHKVWIKGCPTDLCSLATDLLLLIFHLWFVCIDYRNSLSTLHLVDYSFMHLLGGL